MPSSVCTTFQAVLLEISSALATVSPIVASLWAEIVATWTRCL
jgi:hypothetical protein